MNHKHHVKQIHKELEKHSPKATEKAKKLFHFKYSKIFLLIIAIIFAYYIFKNPIISKEIKNLGEFSHIGFFIAGMFLAFGFSAPFAVGFFIISKPENILLAVFIGGLGASFSDWLIFKFIKISFMKEFNNLRKSGASKKINEIFNKNFSIRIRHYLLYIFAGILIATPLPDEIGVSMLAGLTTIKQRILVITSFILHCLAILIILKASM